MVLVKMKTTKSERNKTQGEKLCKWKTIAHGQPTEVQPVTKQWRLSPGQLSPVCMLSMTSYGMEYPFSQFGWAVLAVPPPSFLHISSVLAGRA